MYSIPIAYLLWFISGFGALGFHRFYLGRFGTGLLWLLTGGLGMIGAIFDFFYIPTMVRQNNLGLRYRQAIYGPEPAPLPPKGAKESVERIILRTAQKNKGVLTPGEVALEGNIPIEEARKALDKLVTQGYAEMKVRQSGVVAYVFSEFRPDDNSFVDV